MPSIVTATPPEAGGYTVYKNHNYRMMKLFSVYWYFTNSGVEIVFPFNATSAGMTCHLFKGAKPVVADLDALIDASTDIAVSRVDDLLLTYSPACTVTSDPVTKCLTGSYSSITPSDALQSGEATWWAVEGATYTGMLVGDISDTNGTGELRLASTSIIAGQPYLLSPFGFSIPHTVPVHIN